MFCTPKQIQALGQVNSPSNGSYSLDHVITILGRRQVLVGLSNLLIKFEGLFPVLMTSVRGCCSHIDSQNPVFALLRTRF